MGGVILMGGAGSSSTTTEKIQKNGTSAYSFDLKYSTYYACAIDLGSSVVITGGYKTLTTASQYSQEGWLRDLPPLQQGRYYHGCSYFQSVDGTKTLLVTGGRDGSNSDLSSTELLVGNASAWAITGELPTPRYGLRGTNINNKVLMTGGSDGSYLDEILEFDGLTGQWKLVDTMIQARDYHA